MKNSEKPVKISSIKNKFISFLLSCRLSLWFFGSVFFLLGEWYSIQKFSVLPSALSLIALCGIYSAGAMLNNTYDKKFDVFARKPIVRIFIYVEPKEMIWASFFLIIFSLIILIFINLQVFLLGLIITIFGIIYSVPPIRLKTKPPLDAISNVMIFTLPFFMGWTVSDNLIQQESYIYALIIGLIILYIFFSYTSIDIEVDREFNIVTSCTKLGRFYSLLIALITYIIALVLSLFLLGLNNILTISIIVCLPFALISLKIHKNRKYLVNLVGGRSISFFTGSILILLFLSKQSLLPIFFLLIWLILTSSDILNFIRRKNQKDSG